VIFLLDILLLTAVAPVNLASEDAKVIVYRLCLIDGFEGSKSHTTNGFDIAKVAVDLDGSHGSDIHHLYRCVNGVFRCLLQIVPLKLVASKHTRDLAFVFDVVDFALLRLYVEERNEVPRSIIAS
jgi:hypothetical protein